MKLTTSFSSLELRKTADLVKDSGEKQEEKIPHDMYIVYCDILSSLIWRF